MRDQQGFTDFASARAGDLRRQAYLLTGSPERAVRLADKALAETGRRWDRLGGAVAAEEHARRVVAAGSLRGRGVTPMVALTARGTAAPTDDAGEAVRRALAGLPPRRRAVLVLRYDEGLDDAAVGARLGLPPATAAAEGEAGLVTLRSLLRRRGRPEDLLATALAQTPLPTPLAGSTGGSGGPSASSVVAEPAAPDAEAESGAPAGEGAATRGAAAAGGSAGTERDSLAETGARDRGTSSAATAPAAVAASSNGAAASTVDARPAGDASSSGAAATSGSAVPEIGGTGSANAASAAPAPAGGDAAPAKAGDAASAKVDADTAPAKAGGAASAQRRSSERRVREGWWRCVRERSLATLRRAKVDSDAASAKAGGARVREGR